ncbi:MAG: hypothetical protein J6S71_07440 [Clostridia bacterium]|nr:hypothetical protein [Clostridia bacterium]
MKTFKNFTSGIAVLLCIFICIYVLTLYLKFNPEEPEILEDGTVEDIPGKLEQFLDANINTEEHLTLCFLLAISAAAGFILEKVPAFGMLTSAAALSYALTMMRFEALPKFPKTVVVLCMVHAAGAIFYAATSERGKKSFLGLNSAASGALLCNTVTIGISLYIYRILHAFNGVTEKLEALEEDGFIINTKLAAIPDVMDIIWHTYENHGIQRARRLLNELSKQYTAKGIEEDMQMTFVGEEYSVYLRLAIIVFGVLILTLVFRRRAWVGACLCAIPPICVFSNIMYDKMSTYTLTILTLTVMSAIGAFAAYQREGAPALVGDDGEEIEIEDEDDPLPEEIPASDAEDDIAGESVTDWECSKLDYFYQKPTPDPVNESERDEYLEIEGESDGDQKEDSE